MSKTLFEKIEEVVNKYNSYSSLKTKSTTVYVNIDDDTEIITESDFAEAFKKGKSIKDYKVVTEVVKPKEELIQMIFGDEKPKYLSLSKFIKICEEVTGVKIIDLKEEKPVKKGKEFANKINAINQKIVKAKKDNDTELERKLRADRVYIYLIAKKAPKASFKDMDLYNELKQNFDTIKGDYDEMIEAEK